mmetsp:Transcript_6664/g.17926  ORF Transcript_6664/g.17926 Transcript_6664/m.17926 type:complete len:272 (+) Transcript_6664:2037-2852(+)
MGFRKLEDDVDIILGEPIKTYDCEKDCRAHLWSNTKTTAQTQPTSNGVKQQDRGAVFSTHQEQRAIDPAKSNQRVENNLGGAHNYCSRADAGEPCGEKTDNFEQRGERHKPDVIRKHLFFDVVRISRPSQYGDVSREIREGVPGQIGKNNCERRKEDSLKRKRCCHDTAAHDEHQRCKIQRKQRKGPKDSFRCVDSFCRLIGKRERKRSRLVDLRLRLRLRLTGQIQILAFCTVVTGRRRPIFSAVARTARSRIPRSSAPRYCATISRARR